MTDGAVIGSEDAADTSAVREAQTKRLAAVRAERDEARCSDALEALTRGAEGDANLLELCVAAARARASLGEISTALERVFNRYRPEVRAISGVYGSAFADDQDFAAIRREVEAFAEGSQAGQEPRPDE